MKSAWIYYKLSWLFWTLFTFTFYFTFNIYYRLQDLGTSCLQYLIINFATHKIWVPLALFFLHFPFSPRYVCVIWYVWFDIHPSAHPDNAKWRLLIHISHHINFWCFKLTVCKDCILLYQRWIDLWFSFNLK